MGFLTDFKNFAMRGNVVDLAVGVIIGAAFGKIVDSLVNDLMMPIVGIFAETDFSNFYIGLNKSAEEAALNHVSLSEARKLNVGPIFALGNFITVVINFLILAFIIFLLVKGMTSLNKKKEEAPSTPPPPPEPTLQEKLLMEIRDELKNRA